MYIAPHMSRCALRPSEPELDPALEAVLLQQTFEQGGQDCLQIGKTVVPFHADFRLYMTTKLCNPRYTHQTAVKVTILAITTTFQLSIKVWVIDFVISASIVVVTTIFQSLPPNINILMKVTVLDFALSKEGLEQQLHGAVERPSTAPELKAKLAMQTTAMRKEAALHKVLELLSLSKATFNIR